MSYNFCKEVLLSVCFVLFIITKGFSIAAPMDSVGIEKIGNKIFIVHKVDPKETLFSLSRKYNVKVEVIEIENPELREGMKIGQLLRIPYQPKPANKQNLQQTKGKTHMVEQGQTLFSIAKTYGVSVNDIKSWNNLQSNELNVGQELVVEGEGQVEKTNGSSSENQPKESITSNGTQNKIHITEAGQTLYSISRIYNVSVDNLRNWNSLVSNDISAGQELIVSRPTRGANPQNVEESPKKPVVENAVVKQDSQKQTANVNIEFAPSVETPKTDVQKTKVTSSANEPKNNSSSAFNKIIERGLAEAIEESEDNPKFLALHRTAAPGTIIQVKNELNNLYIFARVIGKLPATGNNEKLVVKLSKKAYDKLGAVDRRFPVEVSYVNQ